MTHDEQFAINHFLRSHGLAGLDQAGALASQLAFFVRDHRHFRMLLNQCEPENRRAMYETLAPNLQFKAKPMHEYLIELARDAECRQLPTINTDGTFKPFRVAEIPVKTEAQRDAEICNAAVGEAIANEHLVVVCTLCKREDVFHGVTKEDVVAALRKAGWRHATKNERRDDGQLAQENVEVCRKCVRARAPKMRAA